MRLRQIALAATDLAGTVEALTDVLGIEVGFRDPGVAVFGLENVVMPVGDTYLEVVSPVREDATAMRWIRKRGGDSGYMVILQCDDYAHLERELARAESAGAVRVWEGTHEGARGVHFHPRHLGAILSFDAMPAWEEWVWAGPSWRAHRRTEISSAITGAVLESPEPERLAAHWAEVLGVAEGDGRTLSLPRGGELRFVPSQAGEGLVEVHIALADADAFASRARARGVLEADGAARIAGVRFAAA
ncbi:MAG: VOC family protein [Myxococcota bacterium]